MEITNRGKIPIHIGDGTYHIILRPDEAICFHPLRVVSIESEIEEKSDSHYELDERDNQVWNPPRR